MALRGLVRVDFAGCDFKKYTALENAVKIGKMVWQK
jgi:hypothetical protein